MGLVEGAPRPAGSAAPFTPKPAYNSTAVLASAIAGFNFVTRVDVFQNGMTTDDGKWWCLYLCVCVCVCACACVSILGSRLLLC